MAKHISDIPSYKARTFNGWVELSETMLRPLFDIVMGDITNIQTTFNIDDKGPEGNARPSAKLSFDCDGHVTKFELSGRFYGCDVDVHFKSACYKAFRLVIGKDDQSIEIEFLEDDLKATGCYNMKFYHLQPITECGINVTFKEHTSYIKVLC